MDVVLAPGWPQLRSRLPFDLGARPLCRRLRGRGCNAGDPSSIPGSGRSPGDGIGYPLQYSWASLVAQTVKNHLHCRRPRFNPWVWKIPCRRAWHPGKFPWRRDRLPTPVFMGFPGGSQTIKESACNAGDPGSIPGLGRSPGEENGYPLQYSWASLVVK